MTSRRSPTSTLTTGAFAGIATSMPNRDCIASMLALCEGFRQGSTPSITTALACSGYSDRFAIEHSEGNIEGATPKPKNVFFTVNSDCPFWELDGLPGCRMYRFRHL